MKVLITGAAKRVGRMLAEHLADRGHQLAIHCNSSLNDAREFQKSLPEPDKHTVVQANLSKLEEAEKLLPKLIKEWGKPDVLINNASTYFRRGMSNYSTEELVDDYNVNFFSPLILMREFHKLCHQGRVINFLDRRVDLIEPEAGPYALAKKSLRDATLACAQEWQGKIFVNAIAPGPVLLPEEDFNAAQKLNSLNNIKAEIERFLSSSVSGVVTVIE